MVLDSLWRENLGRAFHILADHDDAEDMALPRFREVLEKVSGRRIEEVPFGDWVARLVDANDKQQMRMGPLIPLLQEKAIMDRTRWEFYEGMARLRTDNVKKARIRWDFQRISRTAALLRTASHATCSFWRSPSRSGRAGGLRVKTACVLSGWFLEIREDNLAGVDIQKDFLEIFVTRFSFGSRSCIFKRVLLVAHSSLDVVEASSARPDMGMPFALALPFVTPADALFFFISYSSSPLLSWPCTWETSCVPSQGRPLLFSKKEYILHSLCIATLTLHCVLILSP